MHITVILCTYNRSAQLRTALTSIAEQVVPESVKWEVLVVDNNSSDRTREVIEDFCKKYPGRFRYLFEGKPGKSNALNSGIRGALGEILTFTDDDVTFDPMWLQNLNAALATRDWVGVGGRIFWTWTCPRPTWLSVDGRYLRMSWPLTSFDFGDEVLEDNKYTNGANMAFRKEVFARHAGFRPDLGPQPGSEIRCEDNEFGLRLHAAGERVGYDPSAIVYHPVIQKRLTKRYFLAWWFDYGKGSVRELGGQLSKDGRVITNCPRVYYATWLMESTARWMLSRSPAKRFYHKVAVWEKAGALIESFRKPQRAAFAASGNSSANPSRGNEAVSLGIPPSSVA